MIGWGSQRGGHGDDVEHLESRSEHHPPSVEDAPSVDAYTDLVEHGKSSNAAEPREQGTDDGLSYFRAMHANSRAGDEAAEARFKMYLETSRQDRQRLEEVDAIERILHQERVCLERRNAQRVTTEARPHAKQVQAQTHWDRKGKGKEPAATNDNAHLREEANFRHGVAAHP
ncbi:hypothetical protein SLS61_008037 [Didymella pomorum]